MKMKKPERVRAYSVIHPEYGKALVMLTNPAKEDETALAGMEAARRWGVRWSKIAAQCEVKLLAEQWRCVCRSCGRVVLENNIVTECRICTESKRRAAANYMKSHHKDRRINAGK